MIKTDGVPMFFYVKHIKKKGGRWEDRNMTYKVTLRIDKETKIEVTASMYPRNLLYMLLGKMSGKREFYNRVCNFIMDYMDAVEPQLLECEQANLDTRFPILREMTKREKKHEESND